MDKISVLKIATMLNVNIYIASLLFRSHQERTSNYLRVNRMFHVTTLVLASAAKPVLSASVTSLYFRSGGTNLSSVLHASTCCSL